MAGVVSFVKKQWFYAVAIALLLAVIGGIVYMYEWGSTRFPVVGQAKDFALTNTDGKTVKLTDSNGKVRLLTFIYTRCTSVCPITTFTMSQVESKLKEKGVFGSDVEFVSVTIDPEHDTPQVLAQYAKEYHADPAGWEFLTGPPSEVSKVLKSYQVVAIPQDGGQIGHPSLSLLIDRNGNIRKQYGTLKDADEVTSDILRLLKQ